MSISATVVSVVAGFTQVSVINIPAGLVFETTKFGCCDFQATTFTVVTGEVELKFWNIGSQSASFGPLRGSLKLARGFAYALRAVTDCSVVVVGDIGSHLTNPTILSYDAGTLTAPSAVVGEIRGRLCRAGIETRLRPHEEEGILVFEPGADIHAAMGILAPLFRVVASHDSPLSR